MSSSRKAGGWQGSTAQQAEPFPTVGAGKSLDAARGPPAPGCWGRWGWLEARCERSAVVFSSCGLQPDGRVCEPG